MHAEEQEVAEPLVRALLGAQFPEWAELTLTRIESFGTDHAIWRLGDELALRFPRVEWAAELPEREAAWLPLLAPHLPLPAPAPLATGVPGEGYPFHWSVVPWLPGRNVTEEEIDEREAARTLASFVRALQRVPPGGGPLSSRGGALQQRDRGTRAAIEVLGDKVDAAATTAAWERALAAPPWIGPPVWLHGDLLPGNLLAEDGRLTGVIDFGFGLGVGDPAVELLPAWALFSGESRELFRDGVGADEATWQRGRGWALSVALIALPYYERTNPPLWRVMRRMFDAALGDD
ncbi:MAG TPA: aminoglycoside phosphotransferase family protein [Gaiellaceae bacterium]|nr:aminoglycoside phosphotransferase family protein [Gaiellaceae bacterium]